MIWILDPPELSSALEVWRTWRADIAQILEADPDSPGVLDELLWADEVIERKEALDAEASP